MATSSNLDPNANIPEAEFIGIQPFPDTSPDTWSPFLVQDLRFRCPLDYGAPLGADNSLEISLKLVCGYKPLANGRPRPASEPVENEAETSLTPQTLRSQLARRPLLVYLCGGPGDKNPPVRNPELNRFFLGKGYWVLYPDYRGTGDSDRSSAAPLVRVDAETILHREGAGPLPRYRQTAIARDLESVRRRALPAGARWSLLGQSFGGWVALTSLSFHGAGLQEVFVAGGLAPASAQRGPRDVYAALFPRVIQRNGDYYAKYRDDVPRVRRLARWLAAQGPGGRGVELPRGGWLSVQRFLCLGRFLGSRARWGEVHDLLVDMEMDLEETQRDAAAVLDWEQFPDSQCGAAICGSLSHATLWRYETIDSWKLDQRPLYAVLHEAMYCNSVGSRSGWAACREAARFPEFWWVNCRPEFMRWELEVRESNGGLGADDEEEPRLYFSGEMVYPFFFDTYAGLGPFKEAAEYIAWHKWDEPLYDAEALRRNEVPVTALSYGDNDMYVDSGLGQEAWDMVGGPKAMVLEDFEWEHGAIRSDTERVLKSLWYKRLIDKCESPSIPWMAD
ncbi:hypothetical protein F4779DRAFT_637833 [Xylariaceae sp. FL0662B]|nr:hypothetical protein F4779DRAFT_637833 [Xylariaceae sp. FL0662B]